VWLRAAAVKESYVIFAVREAAGAGVSVGAVSREAFLKFPFLKISGVP